MSKFIFILFVFSFLSCSKENKTQEIGNRFFEIYSERKDVDKMVSFYAKSFSYENVNFHSDTADPKFLYENFYGWSDPNFRFQDKKTIVIEDIVTNDSTIIAQGTTMPYTYNGKEVDGTRFIISLELDKNLKIKKQTDWFDYPMEEMIEAYYLKSSMKIE